MRILVTGTAGFIGFHVAKRLLDLGHEVLGYDGLTPYYDVALKEARHAQLKQRNGFHEVIGNLEDAEALRVAASSFTPEVIVHLAAQAGVRYSFENPRAYVDSNLIGTFNVMETARHHAVKHFLFASTSSAYGANTKMPFAELDKSDTPLTLYAATKRAGEAMLHSYSHAWKLPTTVFRFFSVYGPWGRPDMALYKFVDAMLRDEPIDVYNGGDMLRDFTYVEDLAEAVVRLMDCVPIAGTPVSEIDSVSPVAPWRLVNIGRGAPVILNEFIAEIEKCLGRKAKRNELPMQLGDAPATWADATLCAQLTGFTPHTPVSVGVKAFCEWYVAYRAAREPG
jgi:UDP-glucuronate 4-epimerase